jgi:putative ABC transport system permease protein
LNSYTFHINLYDLAFIGAIFIGLAFALLLWFTKTVNQSANRFLALALATMILWMIRILAIDLRLETYLPRWDWLPMQYLLALGPLIYFYVLKITCPQYKFSWMRLLHFSPVLMELVVLALEIRVSAKTGATTYASHTFQQLNPVLQLLIFISIITYLHRCDRLIQKFYRGLQPVLMDRPLLEFRWLRRLLAATALLWLFWIICAGVDYFGYPNQPEIHVYYPFYIFFVVMIIWTAMAAFLRPQAAVTAAQTAAPIKPPVTAELRAKGVWVKRAMEANRYYEEPELSLSSLAEKLSMHPNELSRVINTVFKKSFTDLINEYRIKDVVVKMQDPAYDRITLLGIAFEAGFNSKSTFNRAFRQMTGKSAAEYKTEMKKVRPSYNLTRHTQFAAIVSYQQASPWRPDEKLNRNFMFKNYFKTAFRHLWRNKIFSLINIIGLSVGLACCMLIFLYAKDELSYDRFHNNAPNICYLTADYISHDGHTDKYSSTGTMPGPSFKRAVPELQDFVRVQDAYLTVKHGTDVFDQEAFYVDKSFFNVFTFPLLQGNPQTALNNLNSVVLSEEVAEKYFGTKKALGEILELKVNDTFRAFTVTGITKKSPQNSTIKIKMLLPLNFPQGQGDNEWFSFFLTTFFVLKPGADIAMVEKKMDRVYNEDAGEQMKAAEKKLGFKDKILYGLQPFTKMHTSIDYPADNGLADASKPVYSYILTGIALFILLIACINFVNLTVARSLKRAKEIGIRKVAGGLRSQLIAQFLGESFILSLAAFLFAIVLVVTVLPFFNTLANKMLSFAYLLDAKLIAGYTAIFLITGLLAGFYPALVLSRFNPVDSLYNRQKFAGKNYLSKGLVVLQFTLATFLIISTITIYSQFDFLMHYKLGYNDKNVAIVKAGGLDAEKLALLKAELLKNRYIINVTADQGGREGTSAHVNNIQEIGFDIKRIDESYLPLFEIPVIKGRNFSRDITSDSAESVLVNESFVKEAGWKDPVGQVVDFFYNNNKKFHVIGVVKDYHFISVTQKAGPLLLTTNPRSPYRDVFVKLTEGRAAEQLNFIQETFKRLYPYQPYQYSFKDAKNAEGYNNEAKWKQIVTFGAALTIFISCIGLFGLATLSAERRKKEIGIRKVLGASVRGIVTKLSNDFLKLVILAALIASPAAWWAMQKWLENYPYRIELSGWIFGFAAIFVLSIALATVSFQSIKAAVENPVKSLRTE